MRATRGNRPTSYIYESGRSGRQVVSGEPRQGGRGGRHGVTGGVGRRRGWVGWWVRGCGIRGCGPLDFHVTAHKRQRIICYQKK